MLAALRADENAIVARRANIRRFGAGWLRPPGVGKTLQGMADERAEREEVELARAREMAVMEMQVQQDEIQGGVEGGMPQMVEEGGEGERDLDEDVPEADDVGEEGEWSDDDGDELEVVGGFGADDFAEGVEGSYVEGEANLDDGIPDADAGGMEGGSYEHTDTELEDESSDDGVGGRGVPAASGGRRSLARGGPSLGVFDRRTGEVVGGRFSGGMDASPSMALNATGGANATFVGGENVLGSSVFGQSSSPVRNVQAERRQHGERVMHGRWRENQHGE